ncbi:NADH-ubiquinone oxidoreductase-F iron-sulfur binding region domain-containing protein [Arthrobacter oryzae]|uniref:NADH dehydrogenase subunit F n=1 Tax=Arthrobacter oryzae TaxID=409290 RepID=A0A495ESI5_9MICC|nr:NADH-ubiquinone oxidoreductase-F iron-sulfur binding region domain-containing protein [Arthrobacter oryzae]RKR19581.1 NADH dehydrogenase subunit F [Arthrobacter oryzae]
MNPVSGELRQASPPHAQPVSRLLAAGPEAEYARHADTFGHLDPDAAAPGLLNLLEASGLTGRGGAAFATWRKAVATSQSAQKRLVPVRPVVIANGAEGEPLSFKDRTLLAHAPHLVLDGLLAVARAVAAAQVYLYAPAASIPGAQRALAEHPGGRRIQVVASPDTFISGEASAVVNNIATGSAIPLDKRRRLSDTGLKGRPTLVLNVETLAHVALIARFGADWFRAAGTPQDPGTRLVSVSGRGPGRDVVLEVPGGALLTDVLQSAGMDPATLSAVLVGGYHGRWVRPAAHVLAPNGPVGQVVRPGAGVIHALADGQCGLQATAGIVTYLAGQSARQCGPCMFGLPAMAGVLNRIAAGEQDPRLPGDLDRLANLVTGRGACHHPDGTVQLIGSALEVFSGDVRSHLAGRCSAVGIWAP